MLVKNWMSTEVVTIDVKASLYDAVKLIKKHRIRMLPVVKKDKRVKKDKLVGVVTDRDLKKASASDATLLDKHELLYLLGKVEIRSLMTRKAIIVPPDYTVEETAEILLENKISGVPVVDNNSKIVGIITKSDLFRVLIALTGIGTKGMQFAFRAEDRSGSITEIADVIREYGGRTVSILSSYENAPEGYRNVYIRCYDINRQDLERLRDDLYKVARPLYFVDHRKNRREIYE